MAHGREVLLPFLNHELVQFIFTLKAPLKIHDGWTKYLLRKAMDKKLPDAIVWRTNKVGFEPPQELWMQDAKLQDYIQEAKTKISEATAFLNHSGSKQKDRSLSKLIMPIIMIGDIYVPAKLIGIASNLF